MSDPTINTNYKTIKLNGLYTMLLWPIGSSKIKTFILRKNKFTLMDY